MDNIKREKNSLIITKIGLILMIAFSLTQLLPSISLAYGAVFLGVCLFFITRALDRTPRVDCGMNFRSLGTDIKKKTVILWMIIPMFITSILPVILDKYVFDIGYTTHVLERVGGKITFNNIPMLVFEVIILAYGEEIAWRGFFVNKTSRMFPFWICAVVSSVLFAIGHIASGNIEVILFDLCFVFIDSLIFAIIFKKSGNCLVSTIAHIIGNAIGLIFVLL